jgi:hypothetical protein
VQKRGGRSKGGLRGWCWNGKESRGRKGKQEHTVSRAALALAVIAVVVADEEGRVDVNAIRDGFAETMAGDSHGCAINRNGRNCLRMKKIGLQYELIVKRRENEESCNGELEAGSWSFNNSTWCGAAGREVGGMFEACKVWIRSAGKSPTYRQCIILHALTRHSSV